MKKGYTSRNKRLDCTRSIPWTILIKITNLNWPTLWRDSNFFADSDHTGRCWETWRVSELLTFNLSIQVSGRWDSYSEETSTASSTSWETGLWSPAMETRSCVKRCSETASLTWWVYPWYRSTTSSTSCSTSWIAAVTCFGLCCKRCVTVRGAVEPCTVDIMRRMRIDFPGDVGVFSPLYLNHMILEPGECCYYAAQELHAYISGECVECVGCSNNTIRAAMTPKYIDRTALIHVGHRLTYVKAEFRFWTIRWQNRQNTWYPRKEIVSSPPSSITLPSAEISNSIGSELTMEQSIPPFILWTVALLL